MSGHRIRFIAACVFSIMLLDANLVPAQKQQPGKTQSAIKIPNRPQVPGKFRVQLQTRGESKSTPGNIDVVKHSNEWQVGETAIIICDMWDNHYCQLAAQRVAAMAPRMNRVISATRAHGAQIIHAPSGTMNVYAKTEFRQRVLQAKTAKPPVPILNWCYLDPKKEAAMPVDTSKQACDDPIVGPAVRRFSKQHAAIEIIGYDGISDNGVEIYNFLHQEGIKNVVIMGVHTNMCVLGRPFGIRQMTRLGFNVALARDLTDAMYDPRQSPYVSHTRGTELVIEHIERYWCPTLLGKDLVQVIPGSNDPDPKLLKKGGPKVTTSK